MTNWIYFVLIAQFIWSFTTLIDKIVISKGYIKNPLVYIVLNGLMNIFLVFLLPFVGFEPLKFLDFLVALFSGAIFSSAIVIYYKAVQYDEISRIMMLRQLEPVFVLVLSFLFLGEALTRNNFIGFLFLLAAGIIVSYRRAEKFKLSKAFYYMLISALFGAFYYVSTKHVFNVTSFWSAFLWLRLTGFTALAVLLVPSIKNEFVETFKAMDSNALRLLGFKMVIDFSAFIFAGYALSNSPASLYTVLSSSVAPLFVFTLALLFSIYLPNIIKEEIDKMAIVTKVLAIALIVIGIVFVNS